MQSGIEFYNVSWKKTSACSAYHTTAKLTQFPESTRGFEKLEPPEKKFLITEKRSFAPEKVLQENSLPVFYAIVQLSGISIYHTPKVDVRYVDCFCDRQGPLFRARELCTPFPLSYRPSP